MRKYFNCRLPASHLLILFILMLLISFAAVNIGAALWGSSRQIDLTANQRYTLSSPTIKMLSTNQQPWFVRLYLSPELDRNYPALAQYANYVVKFLEQYKNAAHNQLSVEIIETSPFTSAEAEAQKQGIRGFLDKSGRANLYFGAVLSNDQGDSFTIPYFEPRRQNYLEHDLSRTLAKLNDYQKPLLGVISPLLNVMTTTESFDNSTDWPFIQNLRQDYELEYINVDKAQIPLRIKTLLVVDPQNLPPMSIYALDQYLMRGGKVILFLDPFSEAFLNLNGHISTTLSNLGDFLTHRGIGYSDTLVAGDESLSSSALLQSGTNASIQNYPLWLNLQTSQLNLNHPLTKNLQNVSLKSAGALTVNPTPYQEASTTVLLSTTGSAGTVPSNLAMYSTKSAVKDAFKPVNQRYALAVLQEGNFSSFYRAHPLAGSNFEEMMFPFLSTSIKPGRLLVMSDSDLLFAPNWNAASAFRGQGAFDFVPYNNNYDLVERAVDYMTDNTSLPNVVAKNTFSRRLSIGQSLQNQIESRYADQYQLYDAAYRQAKFELEILQTQLRQDSVLSTASLNQKQEILIRSQNENQQKLHQLEFTIQQQYQKARNRIILLNLLVWPMLLIVLIGLLNWLWSYYNRRQAREYTHE